MNIPRITVVLADSARARIFTVEKHRGQAGRIEPALEEHRDLIHAQRRMKAGDQTSDPRAGRRRGGSAGAHSMDDHREAKSEESDRRFADEVMSELGTFCGEHKTDQLLIVAPPRFLGHLRKHSSDASAKVSFVNSEISELSAPKALEHLTRHGHLKLS